MVGNVQMKTRESDLESRRAKKEKRGTKNKEKKEQRKKSYQD